MTDRPSFVTLDAETIPTDRLDVIEEITAPIIAAGREQLDKLAPPGNLKKQETIDAWWIDEAPAKRQAITEDVERDCAEAIHRTGLDGAFGRVAVVSYAIAEDEPITIFDEQWEHPDYERWLLNELAKGLDRFSFQPRLVGHNIAFDRHFLRQRGIVLGAPVPDILAAPVKPWEVNAVFDTMTAWTGDVRNRVTLDKLCLALGLQRKGEEIGEAIDGSQVWDYVKRGEIAKVAAYCAADVKRTRDVYLALTRPRLQPFSFTPTSLAKEAA